VAPHRFSRIVYRWLLRGYPRRFRQRFQRDMEADFVVMAERMGLLRAWRRILADAMRAVPLATIHAHEHTMRTAMRPVLLPGESTMQAVLFDLRYAVRALVKSSLFTLVSLPTLALGIGAASAIFTVVNAVLLRPLPWREPDRAVMIWSTWTAFDKTWISEGELNAYRSRNRTLAHVAAWNDGQINVTGGGEPERVAYAQVTANLFTTLGVQPMLGRGIARAEDVPNGPDVVVIGHGLWVRRYAADPSVLGRTIRLNGRPFQIVGVMPHDFVLPTDFANPEPTQLWTPLQVDPASTDYGSHGWYAAARLRPGVSVEGAAADVHRMAAALTREGIHPVQMRFDTVVLTLRDEVVGPVRGSLLLLFGAVGFLLLIACANVANLMLVRAESRQRETAVRAALGAGAGRIVRQMLAESLVLSAAASAFGLVFAWTAVRVVAWWNPASIPRLAEMSLDWRVLCFTAGVAVLTSALFGLAPALRAFRVDLTDWLRDGQRSSGGVGSQRFRSVMVVAEMALAVVLLAGAGLMLRSLWSLQKIHPGFNPSQVLTLRLSLPEASYQRSEQVVLFYQQLLERVRAVSGVKQAGAVRSLPLASPIGDWGLQVDGYVPPPGTGAKGDWEIATDGYFEAMGEHLVRGRTITAADRSDTQLVALINETMAKQYWSGRDPVGGRFKIGSAERPWVTVVGIVGDVRHNGLTGVTKEKFYVPHTQWHVSVGSPIRGMTLVVKASGDPLSLVGSVRREIRRLDAALPIADVRTMDDIVAANLSTPAFTGALLASFAAIAVVLSAIGIYGVLSFLVSRRTREIGIRIAMGAGRTQVVRLVLGRALTLILSGLAIGVTGALLGARVIRHLLHDVTPADPASFLTAAALLVAVAVVASLVPTLRATRVDPQAALRVE
jgi:putative ABC transport system permease protein